MAGPDFALLGPADVPGGLAVVEDVTGQCDAGTADGDAGTVHQLTGTRAAAE
jgi:hypothetical protein